MSEEGKSREGVESPRQGLECSGRVTKGRTTDFRTGKEERGKIEYQGIFDRDEDETEGQITRDEARKTRTRGDKVLKRSFIHKESSVFPSTVEM